MRTLVLSDIHLGNGAGYDIFAGSTELPALLGRFVSPPTRVFLNGDSVDFLMNDDPLELAVPVAVQQARDIAASPDGRAVLEALGRVLAGGGEVVVRLGNHDIELALPEVQAVFRAALRQPPEIAAKLRFQNGDTPEILDVGGARLLLTHGEQNDVWNQVDYRNLLSPDPTRFQYPPGSRLVRTMLNPLKREFGMRFSDLLKPDFQGGALTALAVDPTSVRIALGGSVQLGWQLFRRMDGPSTFAPGEEDLGLADRIDAAGLDEEEREALEAALGEGPLSFAGDDGGALDRAALKLGMAGLKAYARAQKCAVGDQTERFFALTPEPEEQIEARRLATKFGADAVIFGHTHAARWSQEPDLLFVNTGTWIWLMRLPPADADVAAWTEFLTTLRRDPGLKHNSDLLFTRFTGALLEEDADGACVSLLEWRDGTIETVRQGVVRRRS